MNFNRFNIPNTAGEFWKDASGPMEDYFYEDGRGRIPDLSNTGFNVDNKKRNAIFLISILLIGYFYAR